MVTKSGRALARQCPPMPDRRGCSRKLTKPAPRPGARAALFGATLLAVLVTIAVPNPAGDAAAPLAPALAEAAPAPAVRLAWAHALARAADAPAASLLRDRLAAAASGRVGLSPDAYRELTRPYDPALPRLTFAALIPVETREAFAGTAASPADAAPLPRARPAAASAGAPKFPSDGPLLSYAAAPGAHDAPFDAVIGTAAPSLTAAPSDPATLTTGPFRLGWLERLRNLLAGKPPQPTAPGAADWAVAPLPETALAPSEQRCLAEAVYFEARGEPEAGQVAVAQVVLNRVRSPDYPGSICGVVYQNQKRRNRCQFSFACDGLPENIRSAGAWRAAKRVALEATEGRKRIAGLADTTNYHADYVAPRWARRMQLVKRIGAHLFYRTSLDGRS